jgi:glutamate racemase
VIGVFDSGLGGLSVLSALVDVLPRADFIYYADTAHVPYGEKDDPFIQRRVLAIGNELVADGCTLLVVACNTATAAAVQALRDAHPGVAVVGVEPGIKPAAATSVTRKIGVLVTPSTARSGSLQRLIADHAHGVEVRVESCPDWATRVESLNLDDPDLIADVRQKIGTLLAWGADRIVLGCTHYSFLAPVMLPLIAGKSVLIEVAEAVARQTQRLAGASAQGRGGLTMKASAYPERLRAALPALGLERLAARLVD